MYGITDLNYLLRNMKPVLSDREYVFITTSKISEISYLNPICFFKEDEGLTIIIDRDIADKNNLNYESVFSKITLSVHSSLAAVGFLAAILRELANAGISVNTVSAFYHDHLFVPSKKANEVVKILKEVAVKS